ncbi:Phosphofructokinase family protein [Tritrichomonas foetus]|uniref:6-phosphofructokinase n=1 Tax=Tritrichomonas foetus TaxID=1144522 RepID=A0A1J4KAE1_9EUKA|nr:Phosphofructokinase family protein [Tritrichomonas foetus]|eukprot:OHT06660.1 Phosphofructokinase family protein [Tritrichomonas foetus]
MKRIAVLSAGTDNPGINSAIRSITRTAVAKGCEVYGVQWGFRGLIEDHFVKLNSRKVSGIIGKPGSFLGSSKSTVINSHQQLSQCLANLNKKSIEGLIVIGGGGTLAASTQFIENGKAVIGIPSTVQDDVNGTDICLGVDTAVNTIMNCVDHIRSCDSSRNRSFLVEVVGRESGLLAMRAAIVSGAEFVCVPENPCTSPGDLEKLAQQIQDSTSRKSKTQCICLISRGWKPGIKTLSNYLSEKMGESDLKVRETILGHLQRGGQPSAYDRILGTKFGHAATMALLEGRNNEFVALKGNEVVLVPMSEALGKVKPMNNLMNLFSLTNIF